MRIERRHFLHGAIAAPFALAAAPAFAKKSMPPGADWTKWFQDWLLKDFGMIGYYAEDNAKLLASKAPVDIVFLGDSITEGWADKRPGFFKPGRVGRGIGGQTTSQMVLRMMADVVHLRPRAVHIMAGTNDIAGNTGPMIPEMTHDNFRAMAAIAWGNDIKLLIGSVPPAASFPWRPGLETKKPVAEMNVWLKQFAAQVGAQFVDYHPVLNDGTGAMKPGLANDGVHPTEAGYAAMETVIEPVLTQMIGKQR